MLRMSRCRMVLLAVSLVLFAAARAAGTEDSSRWLVSPELLKHAKLKILWENELPIKKAESLGQLLILGNRIYALSDRNFMISLDSEKGNIIFGRTVAPAGFPIAGLQLYGDELISIGGSKLVEIDAASGVERRAVDVGFGIICPASRNSSYFYVGGVGNRLHVLRAKDKVQIFEVAAENDSTITSITADESFVIFTTDAGNVISITPDKPRRLWQFDAAGGITGPIVRDGMSLFFSSTDTNVYRVDIIGLLGRKLVWKYQTEGMLEKTPRVTEEVVYQYVRGKGVTAINKKNGKFMWSVPGGVELLAEAKNKAYVITKDRSLVVMDNVKAEKLYSVNFAGVSRYAANTADSKIYIADERGRIACIQPVE